MIRLGTTEYMLFRLETRAKRKEGYMDSKYKPIPQFRAEKVKEETAAQHIHPDPS